MGEQKPMDIYTADEFQRAISQAAWRLNFPSFCQLLGLRENEADQHSLEMWRAFQTLGTALSKFDKVNLSKIVRHGLSLSFLFCLTITATAQERPARTWATVGVTLTKSTARESAPAIAGLDIRLAYDLRHGLQVEGEGEYRSAPAIERLFTGRWSNRAQSEIRYGAKLNYHFRRFQIGGGVSVVRHFFDDPLPPLVGRSLYNSSVNPTISAGAALGKNSQIVFTKYLSDTYSYSDLRGVGVDFANTRRVSERVYLRSGVRFKHWSFYEGYGHYDKSAIEVGGFVGFQFQ